MADASPPSLPPGMNEDKSWVAIFTVVLCLTVATFMVGLRIYTRAFITKQLGADDYAAVFTLLVVYADGIVIAVSTRFGLGRHIMVLAPTDVMQYLKCFWLSIVLYCLGLLGAKMTFLFQYYRVLAVQRMRIVYIMAIVIVGAWGVSQFLIGVLMCRPIEGFWNPAVPASCIPNQPQFYINAAGNIATDIAVFLLPLPVIKRLNLPRTQKLLLLGIFSLGFFTVAISVIRIKFIGVQPDPTWDNIEPSGWSIGELTSALTCACLSTLRPLFAKFFPSLRGSSARPSTPYHDKSNNSGESGRRRWLLHGVHGADLLSSKDDFERTVYERESGHEHAGRQPSANEHYEQQLGLKSMTRTEIRARSELGHDGERYELCGDGQRAIQVRTDVHQTNTWGL